MLSVDYRPIARRVFATSSAVAAMSEEEDDDGDLEGEGEGDDDFLDLDENDSMRSGLPAFSSFLVRWNRI